MHMKEEGLLKLKSKCQALSQEDMVFGDGCHEAKIMLVGEAPGAKEIEMKKPFVGQAGKNLEEFINILEIERKDLYITNTVKIRPYKVNEKTGRKSNRPPNKEEIKRYMPILFEEIHIIEPNLVVSLGNHALKVLSENKKIAIGEAHGSLIKTEKGFNLFPLYHPASIIYNRSLKDVYLNDLFKLKDYLQKAL